MNKKRFDFWHKWLLVVSIFNIFMGLIIALAPNSFFFSDYTVAMAEAFFKGPIPGEVRHLRTFFFGIIGGTISGYFLLQTCIVWFPFYRKEPWAWHAVFWAIVVWFTIDSSISIYHGAYFNVWMINIWSLLLTVIPLAMTYRDFKT